MYVGTKQDIGGPGWLNDYLITHTSLSSIWHGFAPSFVNYKKGCTRLAAASDKVYQLLAHGRWFSPASSTTKTGRHDIAEILLKVALNTINQIKSNLNDITVSSAYTEIHCKDETVCDGLENCRLFLH